jgi:Flp pilus assembly protein TadD
MADTDDALSRAWLLVQAKRWAEARELVVSVLAEDPSSVTALRILSMCELALDRPEAARRAAVGAIAGAPEDWSAHQIHAWALTALGRPDEAVAAATEAVRLAPERALAHQALGRALLESPHRAKEAYPVVQRAVALDPHDAAGFVLLGVAADKHDRQDEQRTAYLKALELDPGNAIALNNLAAMDLDRGRLGKAARGVTAALQLDPQEQVLRTNLDLLAVRLLRRLLIAVLLGGFLLLFAIIAETEGDLPAWWPRAIVGTVLLGSYATIAWLTLRHLPAGSRRYLRGLPGRLSGRGKLLWVVFLVLSVAILVSAFAPGDAAIVGAAVIIVAFRGAQIVLIFMVIGWVVKKVRGR